MKQTHPTRCLSKTFLMLAALSVTALAGCTASDEPAADPIVVTDPKDFTYARNNSTTLDRPHIHNYWGDQSRLPVLDTSNDFLRTSTSSDGYAEQRFLPEAGNIIPLGAEFVDVTVSWDQTYRVGSEPLELWIKTAADDDAKPFAQLENGGTVRFPSSNQQNDIPHQILSAWEFVVAIPLSIPRPDVGGSSDAYAMTVSIEAEAIRGLEIPPYPAHPDLWHNQTEEEILNAGWSYRWAYTDAHGIDLHSSENAPIEFQPDDGTIVPFNADHLSVDVRNDVDAGNELYLVYHGADTRNWTRAPLESTEGGIDHYVIPVDGNGDSPYALQSVWRFGFRIEGDDEDEFSVSRGDFGIRVIVHKYPEPSMAK